MDRRRAWRRRGRGRGQETSVAAPRPATWRLSAETATPRPRRRGDTKRDRRYKYEQGTSRLEQRPDKKLRAPAWCDRVLWRANARSRASLKSYGCAMDVVPSDHKPVFARLSCRVLEVLPAKRRAVEETATARLDAADARASGAPLLSAESSADLGRVFFDAPSSTTLRLAHAGGGGAVHWRVVGRARDGAGQVLGAGRPAPRAWLSLSTNSGTLLPGDVENLEVVIRVDAKTARRLNAGSEVLSDLLAVHVEGGATLFITVRGDWVPSAWGGALGDLCARGADAADPRVRAGGAEIVRVGPGCGRLLQEDAISSPTLQTLRKAVVVSPSSRSARRWALRYRPSSGVSEKP